MPYKNPARQREAVRKNKEKTRRERKQKLLDGVVCERCGFDDPRALEFHHRDPTTKVANVGQLLTGGLRALLEEVAKCDIICANCHAIEHVGDWC